MEGLAPYKVDNAVILAAGLSSRFAPISYEKPKGVLKVRGEVLIERQIEQLHDAGIEDITVVVGYKKEYFFYLRKKYGVTLVNNDEYASRNNNGSLWRVREHLGNTYVCSSDDYFTQNPFDAYVFKAYYSAQHAEGETKEWCMETGAGGRITKVTVGGADSWYMLGHVYFDRAFSQRFVKILEEEYDRPETTDMLWEDLYVEHIKELDMVLRPYPAGVINEFDCSRRAARRSIPHFLENVDSEIFDNIVAVLGLRPRRRSSDVYPLKQGLTNLSCHFATNDGEYVYRHPGIGTEAPDQPRRRGAPRRRSPSELGTRRHLHPRGPRARLEDLPLHPQLPATSTRAATPPKLPERCRWPARSTSPASRVDDRVRLLPGRPSAMRALLLREGPHRHARAMHEDGRQTRTRLKAFVVADGAPECLTHNDFFYAQLPHRRAPTSYYLIDWEYSGMSDYANDFGTFCVCCQLSPEEVDAALEAYFGRKPTRAERAHNLAHIALAGWCWYLWSLLKEAEGDFVGEWLYIYYNYGREYLTRALALYQEEN